MRMNRSLHFCHEPNMQLRSFKVFRSIASHSFHVFCKPLPNVLHFMLKNSSQQRRSTSSKASIEESFGFSHELLGQQWMNRARLSDDVLEQLMELPGTSGLPEFRSRAEDLSTWKLALQKGTLPRMDKVDWPQEPFRSKFASALLNMEMPRFTRRYPAVLNSLIRQMMTMVSEFETQLAEAQAKSQKQQQQRMQQQQQQQSQSCDNQGTSEDSKSDSQEQDKNGEAGEAGADGGEGGQRMEMGPSQQQLEEQLEESKKAGETQKKEGSSKMQVSLDQMQGDTTQKQELSEAMEKVAKKIVKDFEKQMQEVTQNLERGEMALDDLGGMLEGSQGFDFSAGTWRHTGWKELDTLRKILENCPELRELIKKLGRGGGKGPLRRAPEQVSQHGAPPGVIRSPLQPEEVAGLTRGADLSRMLPSEMALMAHGWPRRRDRSSDSEGEEQPAAKAGVSNIASSRRSFDTGEFDPDIYYLPGAHAARMLHRVRRAERMLLSYDLTGWLDEQPSRLTNRFEIRPAMEMGPIILCLDTSGSMSGAREMVAKALALETLRGAARQRRTAYLYAFSGPEQVQELELKPDVSSLDSLLQFLACSFSGGTDVDRPLELSLKRLEQKEWEQADILMVTDGEIPAPNQAILKQIAKCQDEMGLEVHGLLVSPDVSDAMKSLCSHIHVFKSWTAVDRHTPRR